MLVVCDDVLSLEATHELHGHSNNDYSEAITTTITRAITKAITTITRAITTINTTITTTVTILELIIVIHRVQVTYVEFKSLTF